MAKIGWVQRSRKIAELGGCGVRFPDVGTAKTDEELIRRLYSEHAGVLLGYARRLLGGDWARAEDVVQETLLRAWRHPEAFTNAERAGTPVRNWLLTVTRNVVIDQEHARRVRPREVPPGAVETDEGDGGGQYERVLVAHELAGALESLTPEHRAVITELYFGDQSVAQVATQLRVPVGTVKSRAYYGLRALRVACEERGVAL